MMLGNKSAHSLIGIACLALATPLLAQTPAPAAESTAPADAPAAAVAPEEDTGGIEEIVVTATKRSESAQALPFAITAIGSEELENRGITGLSGLTSGAVPSLKFVPFAGSPSTLEIGIRGFLNPNGTDITQENTVPVYIDDVYSGRQQGAALDLTEIQSLSVLRGPQGTLFGKNAIGGAVQINSKAPTGEFGVRAYGEGGSFGYYKTTAHIDLPKIGDVAAKIDFLKTDSNGWGKNPAGETLDTTTGAVSPTQYENFGLLDSYGSRLALRYTPLSNVTIDYAGSYIKTRSTGAFNQLVESTDLYAPLLYTPTNKRQDQLATAAFRPLSNDQVVENHLIGNWVLSDAITLKSVTAYRGDVAFEWNTATPSSTYPTSIFSQSTPIVGEADPLITSPAVTYDTTHKQFSQELQAIGTTSSVEWVGGLFFMNERGTQINHTYFTTLYPGATPVATVEGVLPIYPSAVGPGFFLNPLSPAGVTGANIRNQSYAAFANAVWKPEMFDKKLAVTVGWRLGEDKKLAVRPVGTISSAPWDESLGAPPPGVTVTACPDPACSKKITERRSLPMAAVAYSWTRDLTTYLRYSTGYRAAAFGNASQTLDPAQADSSSTFELGQKSEFFGHRARVNLAVFQARWKNEQEDTQTQSVDPSVVEFFNGPTNTIRGVELDTSIIPVDGMTISLNGAYYHGKQTTPVDTAIPFALPILGNPVNLPKFSGSASMLYDFLKTSYGTWRANVDVNGTSGYYAVPNATLGVAGYALVNARLGLAEIKLGQNGGSVDLMLFGTNLTDRSYQTFAYAAGGVTGVNQISTFGQPRVLGGALAYRF